MREYITRCQVELAILRCLRPDLMQSALHKLVGTLYDFNYLSFELDILAKFIDPDGTLAYRRNRMSGALATGRGIDVKKNNPTYFTPPVRRATENSIQLLIREAHEESTSITPIYFLVTHSVNVFSEL